MDHRHTVGLLLMAKILLVEDDESLAESVKDWLALSKHTVDVVSNGTDGLEWLLAGDYSVAILDWELPGLSGIQILGQARDKGMTVPVIMMTARSAVDDRVQGLDSGADDYILKPFDLRELGARVRTLLRREGTTQKQVLLRFGDLVLDPVTAIVTCDGSSLKLRRTEYALLELFLQSPGKVYTTEVLLRRVWPTDSDTTPDTVRTHLTRLRQKLQAASKKCSITNNYGIGYKIIELKSGDTTAE
jgi:two-component system, OmpR family, response regulator ArlR